MSTRSPRRRALVIIAWVAALLASAGVGAFIAAHTNPLQPAVETPPPTLTPSAAASGSPTAAPNAERWSGTMVTASEHQLHYGGTCVTDWKAQVTLEVDDRGAVSGEGEAMRTSTGDPCPFTTAQPQVQRYVLAVSGRRRGEMLVLLITETAQHPASPATDLGGFAGTVLSERMRLTVTRDHVRERVEQTSPDGKAGLYRADSLVKLICGNC